MSRKWDSSPEGLTCWRLQWVWVISALGTSQRIATGRQSFSTAAASEMLRPGQGPVQPAVGDPASAGGLD